VPAAADNGRKAGTGGNAQMIRVQVLLLTMLMPLASTAQEEAPLAAPGMIPGEPPAAADIKPDDFAYVAATRADRIGRVMAPVFVNGVGPFAFVVDTGASSSVISPRLVTKLALQPDPREARLLRGITGSEVVASVAVASITAGEIRLLNNQLPVVEPRVFADADGIFGADAFARGCLYVKFNEARVSILRRGCPRVDEHWETLRAELRFGGLPVVRARVGKTAVLAIVDTGAERSLGNRALLMAEKMEQGVLDPANRRQVFAATSQAVFGHLLAVPAVRLGTIDVDNLQLVFGDFEVFRLWDAEHAPAMVLGMDVLGTTQALMIDYQRKELRLLPQGEINKPRVRPRGTATRLP
jgi:predicted aspartyl protease